MDRLQTVVGLVVVLLVAVAVVSRRRLIRFPNVPGPTPKSLANGSSLHFELCRNFVSCLDTLGVDPEFFDLRTGIDYQKSIARTHGLVVRLRRGYLQVRVKSSSFTND